jgi:hypothetical protein
MMIILPTNCSEAKEPQRVNTVNDYRERACKITIIRLHKSIPWRMRLARNYGVRHPVATLKCFCQSYDSVSARQVHLIRRCSDEGVRFLRRSLFEGDGSLLLLAMPLVKFKGVAVVLFLKVIVVNISKDEKVSMRGN